MLPPVLPDVETYHGPEGFRRWWRTWQETFDEIRIDIEEVIDAGDQVVVMASISGVGRDSGAEVRTPSFPKCGR